MPVYEYKCKNCNYEAVLNEKITSKRIKDCPLCKGRNSLERQISLTTFILKGTGWTGKYKE